MSEPLLPAIAEARQRFMDLVAEVRPELHRYSARMTGSVFDGEDVVQDTLAKAYFALGQMEEAPPLRPWLFRIAHNTAMDFLRRYEHRNVDVVAEVPDATDTDEPGADPALVEAALALFASLPPPTERARAQGRARALARRGRGDDGYDGRRGQGRARPRARQHRGRPAACASHAARGRPRAAAALRGSVQRAELGRAARTVRRRGAARCGLAHPASWPRRGAVLHTLRRDHRGRGSARRAGCRRRRSGHRDLPPRVEPHARVLRAGALARGSDRAHPRLPLRPLHHRRRTLHALSFGGACARARVHVGAPARSSNASDLETDTILRSSRSLRYALCTAGTADR